MNDWDRNNLNFILNSSEADLRDFYNWASPDDLLYAWELLQTAKAELMVKEIELKEADTDDDFSEVNSLLERFRL